MKVGCTSSKRRTEFLPMTSPALLSGISAGLLLEALIAKFDSGFSLDDLVSSK